MVKNIKIALFVPTLEGGGAERVAVNLAHGFSDRQIKVEVILVKGGGPLIKKLPLDVSVVILNKRRTLYAIFKLASHIRRSKPDALISFMSHANIIALFAKLIARFAGKLILTEHNSLKYHVILHKDYKQKILFALMKRIYRYADKVIAVSKGMLIEINELLGLQNADFIYNPVEIPGETIQSWPHKTSKPNNLGVKYSILGIGRLNRQKNFDLLIKSIYLVNLQMPVTLNIIGEGEEQHNLENLIKGLQLEKVVFLRGYQEYPYDWIEQSDLFVLSSSWEGLSLALIEALVMGVTAVATDCPWGPAEILENGKYGYLVPINEPKKMAETIIYALKNPFDPEFLKKRAEMFSIPLVTEQYLKVIFPDE